MGYMHPVKVSALLAVRLLLLFSSTPTVLCAKEPPLPQEGSDLHLGVATCAGSTCHGAAKPFRESAVRQNEFLTWHRKDKHSQAYKVLLSDKSKDIARKLRLKSAHRAKICLGCHADNVPKELRGKRFQLSDGVGCEACHGGSVRWLGGHASGQNSHQDNLDAGMYPTDDPVARAKLCLSCHFGNRDKFVTHRIMGAGHPRLSFELDTFTEIQPAHFRVDKDYRARKKVSYGIQTWAIGQLMAVGQFLDALLDPRYQSGGLFPELVFFDCHACHHSMKNQRWSPRKSTNLDPGVVRLNDAGLLMLQPIMRRLAPDVADKLRQATLDLHKATTKGMTTTREAAGRLREITRGVQARLVQHRFSPEDMWAILLGIVQQGLDGEYNDYVATEQAVMALGSIVSTLDGAALMDAKQTERINKQLDKLYEVVSDEEKYQHEQFVAELKSFNSVVTRK